ncbi:MAG: glycosyltransferase [candidate division KSB1 bacterium]|nr:glycosyltransferase [candidate division KSB1 bacterium]
MKTSVILPLRGNQEHLRKAIFSLQNQSFQPDEVIISDGNADEEVVEFLNHEKDNFSFAVRYIRQLESRENGAQCRNNAIRACRGSILILLEESLVFSRDLLKTFIDNVQENSFVVAHPVLLSQEQSVGITQEVIKANDLLSVLNDKQAKQLDKVLKDKQFKRFLFQSGSSDIAAELTEAAYCIWKHDLKKVNGFDEKITGWGGEYIDLGRRLYNAGFQRKNPGKNDFALRLFRESRSDNNRNHNYEKQRFVQINKGDYDCLFGLSNPVNDNITLFLDIK